MQFSSPYLKTFLLFSTLLFSLIFCGIDLTYAASTEELPEQSLEDLKLKPVTLIKGEVGDILRQWYAKGTAAGNVGDYYDNRDNGHSHLKMEDYPQLRKIKYSEEDRKQRKHYAVQRILLPYVVFGNSSTSAGLLNGGSNVRTYYTNPKGMAFLYRQYTHNNLYIYPAHRDNRGGNDVFPTNSPYLIASKGSSGSDRKYMNAIVQTLAAFRPDVKKRLIETGLLMPTIQMILRYTAVGNWRDYLTGKAHPSVGIKLDNLKMIKMAHKLQVNEIPPVVRLKVVEEDEPLNGEDYFSPGKSIKLADTPGVIARIFRGKSYWHRMVVSAEPSFGLNEENLTYHWKVLQGEPQKISIQPLNSIGSVVEIKFFFHERQPIIKGKHFESNRVEIGVFVKTGEYYSAPGFITSFSLDNEARTYDENGKVLEIGYGMGKSVFEITDWNGFFKLIGSSTESRQADILTTLFSRKEISLINRIAVEYRNAEIAIAAIKKEMEDTEGRDKKDLQRVLRKQKKAQEKLVMKKQQGQKYSINKLTLRGLNSFIEGPDFLNAYHSDTIDFFKKANDENRAAFTKEINQLDNYGILNKKQDFTIEITPIRKGSEPLINRLTEFEYALIKNLNAITLSSLFFTDIISSSFQNNFVDQRLISPKFWRDVYHYNSAGLNTGWTRYNEDGKTEFNKDGLMVIEKDGLARCLKGQSVKYAQDPPERDRKGRLPYANTNPLKQIPGNEIWHYRYADDSDWRGEVVKIEKL
jgi:hypothetical protein